MAGEYAGRRTDQSVAKTGGVNVEKFMVRGQRIKTGEFVQGYLLEERYGTYVIPQSMADEAYGGFSYDADVEINCLNAYKVDPMTVGFAWDKPGNDSKVCIRLDAPNYEPESLRAKIKKVASEAEMRELEHRRKQLELDFLHFEQLVEIHENLKQKTLTDIWMIDRKLKKEDES